LSEYIFRGFPSNNASGELLAPRRQYTANATRVFGMGRHLYSANFGKPFWPARPASAIPDFGIGAELWAANEFLSLCWSRILLESLKLQFDSCGGHGKTLGLIRGNIWPLAQFRGPKFHEFRAKKTRKNRSLKST